MKYRFAVLFVFAFVITSSPVFAALSCPGYIHPEEKSGELFLQNVSSKKEFRELAWETKRLGLVAYKNEEPIKGMWPVFGQISELTSAGINIDAISRNHDGKICSFLL